MVPSYLMTHLPTMIIYQRRPLRKLLAHKIVLEVLVHPSETFEYLSSVLAKSGTFQEYWSEIYEVNVNEVNDILVMGNSDEILEDTVEPPGCNDTLSASWFVLCSTFQKQQILVDYATCWWICYWFSTSKKLCHEYCTCYVLRAAFYEFILRVVQSLSFIKPNYWPDNPSRF